MNTPALPGSISLAKPTGERLVLNAAGPATQTVAVGGSTGQMVAPYIIYGNSNDFLTYTAANGFATGSTLYTARTAAFTPALDGGGNGELSNSVCACFTI